ncbi:hypothetical protein [Planobispora rosea]|uniref:hypothetical protein n=1 Tax=Planobispora rosea TaxID=35762 RepID=UPI00083B60E7|nr:hypothetical protein [Planobispora rosea]
METSWQSYQHVEFTQEPPKAFLNALTLPLASSDWEAVNGTPAAPAPATLTWPPVHRLQGPVQLRLETAAPPLSVSVMTFDAVGADGIPSSRVNRWTCSRLQPVDGCDFHVLADGTHGISLPATLFPVDKAAWHTIQVFWNVLLPVRHPNHEDRASCTGVWLFRHA